MSWHSSGPNRTLVPQIPPNPAPPTVSDHRDQHLPTRHRRHPHRPTTSRAKALSPMTQLRSGQAGRAQPGPLARSRHTYAS